MVLTLRFPAVSGVEMKIYKRSLQAVLSFPTSCAHVSFHMSVTLMRLHATLPNGELAHGLYAISEHCLEVDRLTKPV